MFTDVQFMTAKEKGMVLKNWETFLKHGLKKQHFTKRLYEHLHLHCGFIAHYSRDGFYSTYLSNKYPKLFCCGYDPSRAMVSLAADSAKRFDDIKVSFSSSMPDNRNYDLVLP